MAGVLAWLMAVVAQRRLRVRAPIALTAALVAGLSPPLAIYGTQIYPELPAALVTLAGFWWLTGPASRRAAVGAALAVVALPWLSVKYAPVAAVLAAGLLVQHWRAGHAPPRGRVAGRAGPRRHRLPGRPLRGSTEGGRPTRRAPTSPPGTSAWWAIGPTTSAARSGWPASWSTATSGWPSGSRRSSPSCRRRPSWPGAAHPAPSLLLATLVAGWLTATYVALTMQGWWWPGRQTVVVIPLAVLAIAWWAATPRAWSARRVLLAAGLLGVAAYVFLLIGVLSHRHTLIVDFDRTIDPFVRVARWALPNGLNQNAASGAWLALWAAGLVAVGVWSWRRARP